jgi:hypothetical protein
MLASKMILRILFGVSFLFTSTGMNASNTISARATCSKAGIIKIVKGVKYVCSRSGGRLLWTKSVSGSTGSTNTTSSFFYDKRVGDACSAPIGNYGFTGGGLVICKAGIVHYAMRSDVPAAPVVGYLKRPDWYPTLAQMNGLQTEPTCLPSSIKFTYPIVPVVDIAPIIPYGTVIGDHVTPIDHGYIGIKSLYKEQADRTDADYVPVVAPADGIIVELGSLGASYTHRVVIEHGCNLMSVYMVLNKLSGVLAPYAAEVESKGSVSIHLPIKAGEEFGQQRDNPLDFNVFDGTQWLSGYAEPYSYLFGEAWKPFTSDPLPFFTPEIRAVFEAHMQRTVAPLFGKIDYDVVGAASGNWFLEDTIGYGGTSISDVRDATKEITGGPVAGKILDLSDILRLYRML